MSEEQFARELGYQVSMDILKHMWQDRVITDSDLCRIHEKLLSRYNPPVGKLYRIDADTSLDLSPIQSE